MLEMSVMGKRSEHKATEAALVGKIHLWMVTTRRGIKQAFLIHTKPAYLKWSR